MIHPEIAVLYKYMKADKRALHVLRFGQIWYSRPERFNDPFDCDIEILSSVPWDQYAGMIRWEGEQRGKTEGEIQAKIQREEVLHHCKVPPEYLDRVRKGIPKVKSILRGQGILSLSATPTSIPMWSYYADAHSGICIGLKRHEGNALGTTAANPVAYVTRYPEVSYYDLIERHGYLTETVMRSKSSCWRHESEWRVIVKGGDTLGEIPGEIHSVIFGIRTEPDFRNSVLEAVGSLQEVEVLQARRRSQEFEIELVPYSQ